jgi:putative holliday junction resolvase
MSIQESKLAKTSHILGVDFGVAKIGLALASQETKMAFAYNTLPNDKNFLAELGKIIAKENIERIIIGIPLYIGNQKKESAGEKMGKLIKQTFSKIEIIYQNEMFTTKMAQANLIEKGMKNVGKMDDSEAARIILQSWLDRKKCDKIEA